MILQALYRQYQRLVERDGSELSPYGYSPQKISHALVLSREGEPVDVTPLFDTSGKKPVPRLLSVPQSETRAYAIRPNILWDKTSYVFGTSATSKRAADEHAAFKALHLEALKDETDEALLALRHFLTRWTPERFGSPPFDAAMLDANFVFRLDGDEAWLHDRSAAQALRARLLDSAANEKAVSAIEQVCLVTGTQAPVARLHPAIKNVQNAQSSGAAFVSFNQDAFESYGKSQGTNAPISEHAAFAYTSVLNHLLRPGPHNRQRLTIGDATVVFWAEAPEASQASSAEELTAMLLRPTPAGGDAQEAEKIRHTLELVAKGRPVADIDSRLDADTRMHVLGLAPNMSRLSVRFWLTDTLGALTNRLTEHLSDLRLEPTPWRTPPSPWLLALATAPSRKERAKAEDVPPQLAGELMRAILTGGRYPQSLLATLIMRMRADGEVSGLRVALCKAVLNRDVRLRRNVASIEEEVPVSLDLNSTNPGYVLGRLFSTLEQVQYAAFSRDLNNTIRDRYYGAASAAPASIFPMLLRNTQNHMSRLRKDKRGTAVNLERQLQEVIGKLPGEFPKTLAIQDQGRFAIGYYHQTKSRFTKDEPSKDGADNTDEANLQGADE